MIAPCHTISMCFGRLRFDLIPPQLIHGGGSGTPYWSPPSARYKMVWLMRNEDFFILRWGQADFVRAVIAQHSHETDGGFVIGSEGYIPAVNYFDKPGVGPEYGFQRQWLFYEVRCCFLLERHLGLLRLEVLNTSCCTDMGQAALRSDHTRHTLRGVVR